MIVVVRKVFYTLCRQLCNLYGAACHVLATTTDAFNIAPVAGANLSLVKVDFTIRAPATWRPCSIFISTSALKGSENGQAQGHTGKGNRNHGLGDRLEWIARSRGCLIVSITHK